MSQKTKGTSEVLASCSPIPGGASSTARAVLSFLLPNLACPRAHIHIQNLPGAGLVRRAMVTVGQVEGNQAASKIKTRGLIAGGRPESASEEGTVDTLCLS